MKYQIKTLVKITRLLQNPLYCVTIYLYMIAEASFPPLIKTIKNHQTIYPVKE